MKAKASTRRETQHLESFYPSEKKSSRTHLQKIVADHLSISPFLIAEVAQRRHPWGKNWGGWIFWQDAPHLGQKSFSTNKTIFFFTVSIFLNSGSSIDQFPDWFSIFFYRSNGRCWWMRSSIVKKRSRPMKLFVFLELKRKTANTSLEPLFVSFHFSRWVELKIWTKFWRKHFSRRARSVPKKL